MPQDKKWHQKSKYGPHVRIYLGRKTYKQQKDGKRDVFCIFVWWQDDRKFVCKYYKYILMSIPSTQSTWSV